jgi:antirestriction protein ArdC
VQPTPAVFWKVYVDGVELKAGEPEPEGEEANGQGRHRFALRYYSIFNTAQCELPATIIEKLALPEQRQVDPIEAYEKILAGMPYPPEIVHAGDKAFYSPATDRVMMPPRALLVKFQQRYQNSHRIFLNRRIVKNFLTFRRSQFEGLFSRSILGA